MALGSGLMMAGVVLHLAESHGYEHSPETLEHEHAHRHDDGYHGHSHEPMPAGVGQSLPEAAFGSIDRPGDIAWELE
jgi:hypothetical protein